MHDVDGKLKALKRFFEITSPVNWSTIKSCGLNKKNNNFYKNCPYFKYCKNLQN